MDTGLTLKPAARTARTGPRPTVRNAVATELSPAQTVTAASDTAPAPATDDPHVREIILDPHSREVIYRAADVGSRPVIRQVPEEVKLRLRAYTRATHEKCDDENALDTTA
jgi:hypothetical protein